MAIEAATAGWGTDERAIRVALNSLSAPALAEVLAHAPTIRNLVDDLSGTELALVSSLLARGRVAGMSRTDVNAIIAEPSRHTLGTLAAAYAREELLDHHDAFDRTGTGTIHGNQCGVPAPSGAKASDCTMYALDVLKKAFSAKGQQGLWTTVMAQARKQSGPEGLKGTEVLIALQALAGWNAVFWAPDPRNPSNGNPNHPFAYQNVRENGNYYGIRTELSKSIINYRRTDPAAAKDSTGIVWLRRLQFGAMALNGGKHIALIINGDVYEVHWANPATDRDAIEATPLELFSSPRGPFLSGVIEAPASEMKLAWQTP
jgi:hypothetical protein